MINLKNVVQLQNDFLRIKRITKDAFIFELHVFVSDEQLIETKLTQLVVDVYSDIQRIPSYQTLSDAIRYARADLTQSSDTITSFLIDLSTGYDSNIENKHSLTIGVNGQFNSSNKLLLGLIDKTEEIPKDEDVSVTLERTSVDFRRIIFEFSIPQNYIKTTSLYFKFYLQSLKDLGNTAVADSLISITTLISRFSKLTSKPIVELFVEKSMVYAKIDVSNDPQTKSVSIFRKINDEQFEKLFDISVDSVTIFVIDTDHHFYKTTYRFVNLNELGEESDSYVDKVLISDNIKSPVIYGEQIAGGYRLFAKLFPNDVIYARFLYREMSNVSSKYENTGEFLQITSNSISSDITTYLRRGSVYEVAAECIRFSGVTTILGKHVFRNVPKTNDGLSIEIDKLNIDSTNGDVEFRIKYQIQKNDNDILKRLLTTLDSYSLYLNDFQQIKNELEPVVTFQVTRVDLTDGTHSDLGILSDLIFNDRIQSKITGAPQLNVQHTYRYEIKPLIRFSETVLMKLQRQVTSGKKTYTFTPAKFIHPKSLDTGTLYSEAGLKVLFSQSEFEFGESSNITVLNVAFGTPSCKLTPNSITQSNDDEFILTFNVTGRVDLIDYYQIFLQKSTGRMMIDQKFSSSSNVYFVVKVSVFDLDFEQIIVQPVFTDGTTGTPITFSNTFDTQISLSSTTRIANNSGIMI